MTKLIMIVDVPYVDVDPTTTDPHEIAEDMVELGNDHYAENRIEFVSAAWDTNPFEKLLNEVGERLAAAEGEASLLGFIQTARWFKEAWDQ